ncbi:DUF6516 family protein [Geomonas paludis]|uniref:DUF6516 family protein n=2 Tax=Geomonas paludis TaxID=2740185 RepID=A0A6V8MS02_9BACT|nr:DUF6516 family protein [Geomonas paludis]UPU35529.1 DUF6516 family protein [Geomonas paludis]GFO62898.1 hypothetical protein GMPD_08170 [Geomonas paludis]
MGATLVYAKKEVYNSGLVVEAVIWQLPQPTAERPHGLKYRLYCGHSGKCIVRYDNETGKGDHVHYGRHEKGYCFSSLQRLIQDFYNDVERLAGDLL